MHIHPGQGSIAMDSHCSLSCRQAAPFTPRVYRLNPVLRCADIGCTSFAGRLLLQPIRLELPKPARHNTRAQHLALAWRNRDGVQLQPIPVPYCHILIPLSAAIIQPQPDYVSVATRIPGSENPT